MDNVTEHEVRIPLKKSLLKALADEGEIFVLSNGRVFGLGNCITRLYNFRKERVRQDWELRQEIKKDDWKPRDDRPIHERRKDEAN